MGVVWAVIGFLAGLATMIIVAMVHFRGWSSKR